jgi:DUF971 family protein
MSSPVDVAHSVSRNLLVVTWDDGVISELPLAYLRSWCPCAGCQGHGTVVHRLEVSDDVRAAEIHEIGAYALAIRFSDGHDAGIYSWSWLRALAPENEPVGLKRGEFRDGCFVG